MILKFVHEQLLPLYLFFIFKFKTILITVVNQYYISLRCTAWWVDFHMTNTAGVSNLWSVGHTRPRTAMNAAQHKIVNLLKTLWDVFVIMCCNVFNVWPKTTLVLPVWCRDTKSLGTPDLRGGLPVKSRTHPTPYIVITYYWLYFLCCSSHPLSIATTNILWVRVL